MAVRLQALEQAIDRLREQETAGLPIVEPGPAGRPPVTVTRSEPWTLAGDFRVRYEHTTAFADLPARDRGVLRARIGGEYRLGERVRLGGRLVTGDPDDPNSSDTTMGDFVDDLAVSLDRAYVSYHGDALGASAGKFALPFRATDLVWDGDVSPFGVGARYGRQVGRSTNMSLAALYFLVDEEILAADSAMSGAQFTVDLQPSTNWSLAASLGYYDYEIGSLVAADTGDIRDNNLNPSGSGYLSDFDLVDLLLEAGFEGLSSRWPLLLEIDYVRNVGAAVDEDTGYAVSLGAGELRDPGDWRLAYGYSVAEQDAVLAAFSNDNTTYATNYRQHTLEIDYAASPHSIVNLTTYRYRRKDFALANQPGDNDFVTRLRLNLQYRFE